MSVIATFTVPADDFALGATVGGETGTTVRLDRVIPIGDAFIPYFWASDDTVESIQAELRNETDIAGFRVVDRTDGEALVRVEWAELVDGLLEAMVATEASILEGIGEADTWWLQLRFDDHEQLSAFFQECANRDIQLDLETVHNPGLPRTVGLDPALTDPQRETLRRAFDAGYFDVPRGVNLLELAEQMGISDSAVSQRLRRGISTMLQESDLAADGAE